MFDIDKYYHCFATKPNEAFFWHDHTNGVEDWENAWKIAERNNGKTLEMVMKERICELEQAGVYFNEEKSFYYTGGDPDFWDK